MPGWHTGASNDQWWPVIELGAAGEHLRVSAELS